MIRIFKALCPGMVVLAASLAAQAQLLTPRSIQFKGAAEYSDQELMTAAGLQAGTALTSPDLNAHAQKLMDTGLFDGITYKFDGTNLTFDVKPAAQLYNIRLENLPLTPGTELDAKLRERVPLYRGKVPNDGGVLNAVRDALAEILKAQGVTATIETTPYTDRALQKISAISFIITSPSILIGEIQPDGGALDPDAVKVLARVSGAAYDRDGSPLAIARDVTEVYRDKGYLEADANATQLANISIAADAVRIPFRISAAPGPLYKVASIRLSPDMLVSQADFDKQAGTHPGDIADAEHISQNWRFLERQYHNRGYMKAQITPTAALDHAQGTVSYTVTGVAGPVYTMGKLTVENVSDELRSAILNAWKMPAGSVFNEGSILGFLATHGVNPQLERVFAAVRVKYVLHLNDESRTVDVNLRLEKRS